jgi:hypothetical protein
MTDRETKIIQAIRTNSIIGKGTASTIDETYTDEEILAELAEADINSPKKALAYFLSLEAMISEKAADITGEADELADLTAEHNEMATRANLAAAELAATPDADAPADFTGPMTAKGNPQIHTAATIAIIGQDLADRDSDAKAEGIKRDIALTLTERQTIKQAKRRQTLQATKTALTA